MSKSKLHDTAPKKEKAYLAGVQTRSDKTLWTLEESMEELAELAASADVEVIGSVTQKLNSPLPLYMGKGKLEKLKAMVKTNRAGMVIFDDELKPVQQRALERILKVKVIDRTSLILDIFATRASTREGHLQVQLAQAQYLLPRLVGQWSHLERLGGGVGTRGPGETQIETDRRLVRGRIRKLNKDIDKVKNTRLSQYSRRASYSSGISLVGYTNAGKSTLFNRLASERTLEKDQLFSTLDTSVRRVQLPSKRTAMLSDTVGFINKLPPVLIAAFRATLEEASNADLILHVADASHKRAAEQIFSVDALLENMGLSKIPKILVINKLDKLTDNADKVNEEMTAAISFPAENGYKLHPIRISALKGWGIERLKSSISAVLDSEGRKEKGDRQVTLEII